MTYTEGKHHNRTIIQNILSENLDKSHNKKELSRQKKKNKVNRKWNSAAIYGDNLVLGIVEKNKGEIYTQLQ